MQSHSLWNFVLLCLRIDKTAIKSLKHKVKNQTIRQFLLDETLVACQLYYVA